MPFKSKKQRRWMYANKPKMAQLWSEEEKKGSVAVRKKKKKRG
jgi:hypothetical protein